MFSMHERAICNVWTNMLEPINPYLDEICPTTLRWYLYAAVAAQESNNSFGIEWEDTVIQSASRKSSYCTNYHTLHPNSFILQD
jgi:hypothetical protein